MRTETFGRLVRFCGVGGAVFAFDFTLIWLFQRVMPPLAAVSLAYILAVTLHFLLNKWWVFEARQPVSGGELVRYALTVLACWAATVTVVWAALRAVTENVFLAKALAIPPATLLGFVLMRRFVFPPRPAGGGSGRGKG